jgi:hypothetical protein
MLAHLPRREQDRKTIVAPLNLLSEYLAMKPAVCHDQNEPVPIAG